MSKKDWQELVRLLELYEDMAQKLRMELHEIRSKCPHSKLPKRKVIEEYADTCPDCGFVSYCVRMS